jgi:hypothetical protein
VKEVQAFVMSDPYTAAGLALLGAVLLCVAADRVFERLREGGPALVVMFALVAVVAVVVVRSH